MCNEFHRKTVQNIIICLGVNFYEKKTLNQISHFNDDETENYRTKLRIGVKIEQT